MIIPIQKLEEESAVPTAWRPILSQLVSRFVEGDFALKQPVAGVEAIQESVARQIDKYIASFGVNLIYVP